MTWMISLRSMFRSPHGLLAAFLALTLGPALGLVWLGWRLLDQDRALENQRIEERREHAADQVVTALQGALQKSEIDLAQLRAPMPEDDALIVEFQPSGIRVHPNGGLLFQPPAPALREVPSSVYREAETHEFQRQDYGKAISALRTLTVSPDSSIRAGAYLRIARNQRKAGLFDQALLTYAALAAHGQTAVAGFPAELVARRARCALFAQLSRRSDLVKEAAELYALLRDGHWRLSQSVYDVFAEAAAAWSGTDRSMEAGAAALAEAVAWLAEKEGHSPSESGRTCIVRQGRSITLLWTRGSEGLHALAAGPSYVESRWLTPMLPLANRLRVEIAVREMNPGAAAATERLPAATGLPWTVLVANKDVQAEMDEFAGRRNLLLGVFALLGIVIAAGSYSVARAIAHEFAVMRLQSEFVSAVSHEFRTPLTSLRQLSEVLNSDRPLEEDRRRKYFQALDRATRRLQKLVEGLLDFGRMESRAMVYRKRELDAGALVASLADEFQREAVDRGCQIDLKAADNMPPVYADPEALGNAVWNLLDNAVKYSPECRTIWVEVGREGTGLVIRVRDRGVGIPAAERGKILRKFVRGTAAQTLGIKGTGIGLAMVKHIVDAHGGTLRLESAPGNGSTFTIWLPARG
jgi:signal transduction histidine kinase